MGKSAWREEETGCQGGKRWGERERERETENDTLSLLSRGNLLRSVSTSHEISAANKRYHTS